MTKRTRRAVFYVLLALFLVLGAAVVLYAQGWRFDPATWRAEKVGAILVRSFPANASLTLDGKPVANQTNILSQSTVIPELFPRNYVLGLSAPGYQVWDENAAVLPSLVTEFRYAVLVPQAAVSVSTTSVKNVLSAPSGELVMQTEANAIVLGGTTTTIARGDIVSGSTDLTALVYRTAAGAYERYDFGAATTTNLSAALARGGVNMRTVTSLTVDPYDATAIIAQSSDRIWAFNAAQATITLIGRAGSGVMFGAPLAVSPSFIAWSAFRSASGTSAIMLYGKGLQTLIASTGTVQGKTEELQWINNSLLGVLEDDGALYAYDANAQTFQKIADDVKNFAVAGDGSAVAALEHKSFEVFPFANAQTYHRFNLPNVAAAEQVIWYRDANHLFVVYPDSIAFLDLDDLGLRNLVTVAYGNDPLYNPQQNTFYLINSAQKLEQFNFPS
jgi:hypothetical protein